MEIQHGIDNSKAFKDLKCLILTIYFINVGVCKWCCSSRKRCHIGICHYEIYFHFKKRAFTSKPALNMKNWK